MLMNRLLYVSRCLPDGEDMTSHAQVLELAATSASRNTRAQLTGSLLFVDGTFVQVLEGPADAVESTFERICCDFRHQDVKLIDLVAAQERLFPEWGMACLSADRETSIKLHAELEEIRFRVGINAREAVIQMRGLLDNQTH